MSEAVKLRVKLGHLELEFEGPEEYVRTQLPGFIESIVASHRELIVEVPTSPEAPSADVGAPRTAAAEVPLSGSKTTTEFARQVGGKSGPGLVKAALMALDATSPGSSFTRKEIIESMRGAKGFFKESYVNNLTNTLNRLAKAGTLNHVGNEKYSLAASVVGDGR